MAMLLDYAIASTNAYIEQMPKAERKKYGQFFTGKTTAVFMAKLFDLSNSPSTVHVLDAGAGSGILSFALLEELGKRSHIKRVDLVCYETDEKILNLLKSNLDYLQNNVNFELHYQVVSQNYITSQQQEFNQTLGCDINPTKYDLIIGNPPYKKISKDAPEATAMPEICYGAPNLYFLFAAMGIFNLKSMGEMVYIIPRSWTSGAYFQHFREYFLHECQLKHIHLFVSRNKVFDKEDVLQETMIIKVQKTSKVPQHVTITSSETSKNFDKLTTLQIPYSLVGAGKEKYVYLVTNDEEMSVLKKMHQWHDTLPSLGMKMKTGLTVDFRNRDALRDNPEKGSIPLFYSQHIRNGVVQFPVHKEGEYIVTDQTGLRQANKNYLFIKRFTAKEEKRRLQCGIYLSKRYPEYQQISTQNKINFIDGVKLELSECVVCGLYVLFNSTLYDMYYRILNGSTQVNSTEINSMPVPELKTIQQMGHRLIKSKDLSETNCNRILEEHCG
jgi:adenine-specific DNA-methyltransferase